MTNTLAPLVIKPGIVKDYTNYSMEGRWIDGGFVRFRQGPFPEKIGGWVASNSISGLTGIARSIKIWRELDYSDNVSIGTHSHVWLIHRGVQYDITPIRSTADPINTDAFATATSNIVTVTDTAHGGATGDYVTLSAAEITAVTKANPASVSATAHGFSTGDIVKIQEVKGITELNGNTYTITEGGDADTFTLDSTDSSAYDTYNKVIYRALSAEDLYNGCSGEGKARWYTRMEIKAAMDLLPSIVADSPPPINTDIIEKLSAELEQLKDWPTDKQATEQNASIEWEQEFLQDILNWLDNEKEHKVRIYFG